MGPFRCLYLGLLSKRTNGTSKVRIYAGIILNSYLWIYVSGISGYGGMAQALFLLLSLMTISKPTSRAPIEAIWTSSGYLKLYVKFCSIRKFCLLIFGLSL